MEMSTRIRRLLRALVIALSLVIALVSFASFRSWQENRAEEIRRMAFDNVHATVVARIAELSLLEYRYTDVMELSRSFMIGGNSTSLVRFSGVIKAGINDVSRVEASFDPKNEIISLFIPACEILDNTVDVSTVKFWDVKRNIFVPISVELKLQEISAFRNRVQNQLDASGFLKEADERAQGVISALYAGFGAKSVLVNTGKRD